MGIVVRQSVKLSISTYLGMVLGYINILLLFPRTLSPDEFGLTRVIIAIAVVVVQLSQLGSSQMILKYFPQYQEDKPARKAMMFFVLLINIAGFAAAVCLLFLNETSVIAFYEEKSSLFVDYYEYIIPVIAFMLLFRILIAYAKSIFKSVIPSFFNTVGIRLVAALLLGLMYFDFIDFESFMFLFAASYAVEFVLTALYLISIGRFELFAPFKSLSKIKMGEMMKYGALLCLSGSSIIVLNYIDVIMLGGLSGLGDVAIYSVAALIGNVILVPYRSIGMVVNPIIAKSWKENNKQNIQVHYSKTAINQMIIGSILFLGVFVNLQAMMNMLPEGYEMGKWVVLIIGAGQLVKMAHGSAETIINTSNKYIMDLVFNVVLVGLAILANLWLIPIYGILGAAYATAGTILAVNLMRLIYIKIAFGFFPFDGQFAKVLGLFVAGLAAVYFSGLYEMDLLYSLPSSLLVSGVFVLVVRYLRISDDFNKLVASILTKIN